MLNKLKANQLLKNLNHLDKGYLSITTPDGKTHTFQGSEAGVSASIILKDWRVPANMALKGDVGLAEDYRDGLWDTDDLESLFTIGIQNQDSLNQYLFGSKIYQAWEKISYLFKQNSKKGSKKNIHAHYDLGNSFYKLWLDTTMTYSSGIYKSNDETLEQAQHNKYDRILDCFKMNTTPILEIGCGWGGFAQRAIDTTKHKVTGITVSREQFDFAKERLGEKAEIKFQDYRDHEGLYDNIVSIEMFEAVGEKYWATYFDKIKKLLTTNGKAVIQTITMNESDFKKYQHSTDFIRSFIFPGGMLPSTAAFIEAANHAGLKVINTHEFGLDYARTLRQWLINFDANLERIKNLGFDDNFVRLWRFYLAGCAAGFETGHTNVVQFELIKNS